MLARLRKALAWLRGLSTNLTPTAPGERVDMYAPKERLIFTYFDGTRLVSADPMVLYKRVMAVGPELSIDIKLSTSQHQDAAKASEAVLAKLRNIFVVSPYEGGGLTEVEVAELFDRFMAYCEDVKKNSSPPPTWPKPTEVSRASFTANPVTTSSSASGSTASEPSTAGPTPSPSAPASPSGS